MSTTFLVREQVFSYDKGSELSPMRYTHAFLNQKHKYSFTRNSTGNIIIEASYFSDVR